MLETETVVVGAGIVGLSVSDSLKDVTDNFLCLESESETGSVSSGGDKRIFRLTHNKRALNIAAIESLPLWKEWEAKYDQKFLNQTGHLSYQPKDIKENIDILKEYDVNYEIVQSPRIQEIFPIYKALEGNYLFTPEAAVIDSRAIIQSLSKNIKDNLLTNYEVADIVRKDNAFIIKTNKEEIHCRRVVLAAGVNNHNWADQLGLQLPKSELSFHLRPVYRLEESSPMVATSHTFNEIGLYCLPTDSNHLAIGLGYPSGSSSAQLTPEVLQEKFELIRSQINKFFPDALDLRDPEWRDCPSLRLKSKGLRSDGINFCACDNAVSILGGNLFKFAPLIGQKLAAIRDSGQNYQETW